MRKWRHPSDYARDACRGHAGIGCGPAHRAYLHKIRWRSDYDLLPHPAKFKITLRSWSGDDAGTNKTLDEMVERITLALGENIFTHQGQSLEHVVADALTLNQAVTLLTRKVAPADCWLNDSREFRAARTIFLAA